MSPAKSFEIVDSIAPLRGEPSSDAMLLTQALKGERATIYDRNGEGWAWGQLNSDGYVGWLPDRALAKPAAAPTHKITAIRTFAFPGPSIKLPPVDTLPDGGDDQPSLREDGPFAVTREGWYLPLPHLGRHRPLSSTISSRSPNGSSARPICGAARAASASIAPGWSRSR